MCLTRNLLEPYKGKTVNITAKVSRYGANKKREPTICLFDVRINGELVSEHCWVSMFRGGLRRGTNVNLTAKVQRYKKPPESIYDEAVIDYRLSRVKEIRWIRYINW